MYLHFDSCSAACNDNTAFRVSYSPLTYRRPLSRSLLQNKARPSSPIPRAYLDSTVSDTSKRETFGPPQSIPIARTRSRSAPGSQPPQYGISSLDAHSCSFPITSASQSSAE